MKETFGGGGGEPRGKETLKPVSRESVTWEPEFFRHKNADIAFFGLSHVPETLKRYGKELRRAIDGAALIFLEGAPVSEDRFDPKVLKEEAALVEKLVGWPKKGWSLTPEGLRDLLERSEGIQFFRAVDEMARLAGKPIAVADPLERTSHVEKLRMRDDDAENVKEILAMLGATSAVALIGDIIARPLKHHRAGSAPLSTGKILRRTFLKGAGALAASVGAATGLSRIADEVGKLNVEAGSRTGSPLGAFIYSGQDYRDVVIARAIDALAARHRDRRPITVIYGALHREPVKHYLENPAELSAKLELYRPYWDASRPTLRIFRYDPKTRRQESVREPL